MNEQVIEVRASDFAKLVRPVIPLAGKDRMLPILNVVRIESRGQYLVATATDRIRLGVSRIALDNRPPAGLDFLIRLSELRQLLSIFKPTRDHDPVLNLTLTSDPTGPDRIRVTQAMGFNFMDASMTFGLEQGDYPSTAGIIAKHVEEAGELSASTAVNPVYLADFKHAPRERNEPLIIHTSTARHPVIITAGDYFIGALMPTRSTSDEESVADWAKFLAPEIQAKKTEAAA